MLTAIVSIYQNTFYGSSLISSLWFSRYSRFSKIRIYYFNELKVLNTRKVKKFYCQLKTVAFVVVDMKYSIVEDTEPWVLINTSWCIFLVSVLKQLATILFPHILEKLTGTLIFFLHKISHFCSSKYLKQFYGRSL